MSWKTGSQQPYINGNEGSDSSRALSEGQLKKLSHEKFKFWFQCHMLHAESGSKEAARHVLQATIFVIAIVDGVCRAGFRATSSAKLNTGERQCRRGKILALDKRQRQRQLRQRDSGLGPGKPNPRPGTDPDKKGAALSLCLSAAVVCVDDWFHGKVDFNQQMFMQFFLAPFPYFFFALPSASRLGRLGVCRLTRIMTLSVFGALYRGHGGEGRSHCLCLSLNCPERIIKSSEHWTSAERTDTKPKANRTEKWTEKSLIGFLAASPLCEEEA